MGTASAIVLSVRQGCSTTTFSSSSTARILTRSASSRRGWKGTRTWKSLCCPRLKEDSHGHHGNPVGSHYLLDVLCGVRHSGSVGRRRRPQHRGGPQSSAEPGQYVRQGKSGSDEP